MAIKNIIAMGVGFSVGSVKYIPVFGFLADFTKSRSSTVPSGGRSFSVSDGDRGFNVPDGDRAFNVPMEP